MIKADWFIAVGFVLFILGIAGIVQETTPHAQPLAPGLLVLVTIGFLIGLALMGYGAVKSSRQRAQKSSNP